MISNIHASKSHTAICCSLLLMGIGLVGCHSSTPVAVVTPEMSTPNYWLAQPATSTVIGKDFDTLWNQSEAVLKDYLFEIDRRDQRDGLLTSKPMVSAQWFEPWRQELQTFDDVTKSSTQTIRRTVYMQFIKADNGTYSVVPRVIVDRHAIQETRVSAILSRAANRRDATGEVSGSREQDNGVLLPTQYWYAIGRDTKLEEKLAQKIRVLIPQ